MFVHVRPRSFGLGPTSRNMLQALISEITVNTREWTPNEKTTPQLIRLI